MAKSRPFLREAVWRAHGEKCAYTGRPLALEDVVLDHVVPKFLAQRRHDALRATVLAHYGIDAPFGFDDPANLLPTTQAFNNRKHKKTLEPDVEPLIRRGLALARAQRAAVVDWELRLAADARINAFVATLPPGVVDTAGLRDALGVGRSAFPVRTDVLPGHVRAAHAGVLLDCYLPTPERPDGSAGLFFHRATLRDCVARLGHRDIASRLLPGAETPPDDGARLFLGPTIEGGITAVQLAGMSVWADRRTVEDLCAAVDAVAPHYLAALERLEGEVLRSAALPFAARGYRIVSLPGALWSAVMAFVRAHDAARGASAWHVFHPKIASFLVYCADDGDGHRAYRAALHAEPARDTPVTDRATIGNNVWLCWDPHLLARAPGNAADAGARFAAESLWTGESVVSWARTLVDAAVAWGVRERRYTAAAGATFGSYAFWPSNHPTRLDLRPRTLAAIVGDLRLMQAYYAGAGAGERATVPAAPLRTLYDFAHWALEHATVPESSAGYIRGNLGVDRGASLPAAAAAAADRRVGGRARVDPGAADDILRVLLALFEDDLVTEHEAVRRAVRGLTPMITETDTRLAIARAASRPW